MNWSPSSLSPGLPLFSTREAGSRTTTRSVDAERTAVMARRPESIRLIMKGDSVWATREVRWSPRTGMESAEGRREPEMVIPSEEKTVSCRSSRRLPWSGTVAVLEGSASSSTLSSKGPFPDRVSVAVTRPSLAVSVARPRSLPRSVRSMRTFPLTGWP